jgi:hypothetical protein
MLNTCDSDEDDLLPESDFDYSKAKPNRFAIPELPIEQQQEGEQHIQRHEANLGNGVTREEVRD